MNELDRSLENSRDNIGEAKKFSLGFKIEALHQLILQRFQALTTISAIAFAIVGIILSADANIVRVKFLGVLSAVLFVFVALVSLGRHLYLIRNDIDALTQSIRELPAADWSKPLEDKRFRADYWPETLYVVLIIGVLLFSLSLWDFSLGVGEFILLFLLFC